MAVNKIKITNDSNEAIEIKDFESWGDTLYITLRTPVTQKQDIENVLREFVIYLGGFGLSDEQIENLERFLRERLHPYTRTRS